MGYVAEGSFGTQYAKVPVSMRVQCIRKEGGFEEATLDAVLKTMGMTFISVKYEDRTNTCPQSYYRNCECVPNMSSQFVGSGCTTHPKFDGAEGCYVYKGRDNTFNQDCTNGMPLGTAEPRAGVEDISNSLDYGVDGVNFGWSYRACGGAQYYPGDKEYKGVQYGDLIWMKPGHACQWGEGGTLSEVPYSSKNDAVEACYNRNLQKKNTCLGVYDARCDDTGSFYLCSVDEELTRSGQGSCVWTMLDTSPDPANNPFDYGTRNHETPRTSLPTSGASCPASHPYAYRPTSNFDHCCATTGDCRGNPTINGGDRALRSDCCEGHQYTKCTSPPCGDYGRRREELIAPAAAPAMIAPAAAPGGETSFQELYIEFGSDLRPQWCEKYGCEDFEARLAELQEH